MIQLNPRYEAIFNPDNIDQDCDKIASLMNVEADFIKEALDAGQYKHTTRITSSILLQTSDIVQSTIATLMTSIVLGLCPTPRCSQWYRLLRMLRAADKNSMAHPAGAQAL